MSFNNNFFSLSFSRKLFLTQGAGLHIAGEDLDNEELGMGKGNALAVEIRISLSVRKCGRPPKSALPDPEPG